MIDIELLNEKIKDGANAEAIAGLFGEMCEADKLPEIQYTPEVCMAVANYGISRIEEPEPLGKVESNGDGTWTDLSTGAILR